jgi:hypothetical protein
MSKRKVTQEIQQLKITRIIPFKDALKVKFVFASSHLQRKG